MCFEQVTDEVDVVWLVPFWESWRWQFQVHSLFLKEDLFCLLFTIRANTGLYVKRHLRILEALVASLNVSEQHVAEFTCLF